MSAIPELRITKYNNNIAFFRHNNHKGVSHHWRITSIALNILSIFNSDLRTFQLKTKEGSFYITRKNLCELTKQTIAIANAILSQHSQHRNRELQNQLQNCINDLNNIFSTENGSFKQNSRNVSYTIKDYASYVSALQESAKGLLTPNLLSITKQMTQYNVRQFSGRFAKTTPTYSKFKSERLFKPAIETLALTCAHLPRPMMWKLRDQSTICFNHLPNYFDKKLPDSLNEPVHQTGFYTYENGAEDKFTVHVIFANATLGGGVFRGGFVQEEIACIEIPDHANMIALKLDPNPNNVGMSRIKTRKENDNSVTCKPRLTIGAHRVGKIEGYGYESLENQSAKFIPFSEPQTVNLLSIAAPDLRNRSNRSTDINTLYDIFHTLVTGFALAKTKAQEKTCVINTGPFGCGAFKNNHKAVFALQLLAAQFTGVEINTYGFSEEQIKEGNQIYTEALNNCQRHGKTTVQKHIEEIQKLVR